jgi:hypothetical protein
MKWRIERAGRLQKGRKMMTAEEPLQEYSEGWDDSYSDQYSRGWDDKPYERGWDDHSYAVREKRKKRRTHEYQ